MCNMSSFQSVLGIIGPYFAVLQLNYRWNETSLVFAPNYWDLFRVEMFVFLVSHFGNHVADVLANHRAKHLVSFVRGFIYLWIVSCVALIILMYEDRFTFLNYHTVIRLFYQTLYREFYISCKGFSSYFVITISVEWNDCFILKKKNKELC